ncbi:hypothetical protein UlMin_034788 [Ulmus minor]
MNRRKKLRNLLAILNDKGSILRATFSTNRRTASLRAAVLRATTHDSSSPPSDNRIASVLTKGNPTRATAGACIEALMDRLQYTRSAIVALKCLFLAHNIIWKGSFFFNDQLSFYPSSGGKNFLNLSGFQDKSDMKMKEFSSWVRWYASILEQNLSTSRVLGYYLCSSFNNNKKDRQGKFSLLLSSELLEEVQVLVDYVERVTNAPDWLHLRSNDLVYEVVRLVSEDYRSVQHELVPRVEELGERAVGLSYGELTQLVCDLKRLEDFRESLFLLFGNRKRNDQFWDLIKQTRDKVFETKETRDQQKKIEWIGGGNQESESTRFWNPFVDHPGQLLQLTVPTLG